MSHYLRHYQSDAKVCVLREWQSVPSTLVVLPTGCGKTVLFAAIIEACLPNRSLVLAHREELIWQARDKLQKFAKLDAEIEMAELYANPNTLFNDSSVVISTVQTQASRWGDRRRMGRFQPTHFNRIIFDECHHSTARSYKDLFHYYKQNPNARFLGVTATPDRLDEESLGQVFDTVAFDYEILDAIHDGWLVPINQQFVHVSGLDFSACRTTAGDLNGADLAAVMDAERNLQGVASATLEIVGNKRTIVFCASVHQAEMISNIFNRHRSGMSNWVCGKTNKDVRRQMLSDFSSSKFQIICNCGVLTEGYDDWGVECIAMAKPTKSRAHYAQMAGRATRTVEGLVDPLPTPNERREAIARSRKPSCLIIDFVGNSGRHKLMSVANILGGKVSDEAVSRAILRAKKVGVPVPMSELLDEEELKLQQEIKRARLEEESRRAKLVARAKYSTKIVNPFDAWDLDPVRDRGWDKGKSLSVKQRAMLMTHGIDPSTMSYSAARAVIGEMFRRWDNDLCTLGQAKVLKRYNIPTKELKKEDASKLLDKIASNNWKLPKELEAKVEAAAEQITIPTTEPSHYNERNPFDE